MDIFIKKGLIFMVQVDHLSGEDMGQVISYLYDAGASNVQVVPTITKKNRPSHIFFIDSKSEKADKIEEIIAKELTSGGWHRIDTEHRHLSTEIIKHPVLVKSGKGSFEFIIQGKKIGDERLNIRPEHQCCIDLKNDVLEKFGTHISLSEANFMIREVLNSAGKKEILI